MSSAYYNNIAPSLTSYAEFIQYTQNVNQDAAQRFWKAQLKGANRASFPPAPKSGSIEDKKSAFLTMRLELPKASGSMITTATVLRTAWALVLARYCETDDICFGAVVSGRQAPLNGIETMAGAVVATVPTRVRLQDQERVSELLKRVQRQTVDAIEFEQFGLQNISSLVLMKSLRATSQVCSSSNRTQRRRSSRTVCNNRSWNPFPHRSTEQMRPCLVTSAILLYFRLT